VLKLDKLLKLDNPVSATIGAMFQTIEARRNVGLDPNQRLDGKTVMVTGANSGLGKATAIDLARRGAHVIMACRSGIPEAGHEVARLSGSNQVEMVKLDLAEFAAVEELAKTLRERKVRLDILVLNAAVVPSHSRRTKNGFEQMFQVNFLSNFLFLRRLLADGIVPNRSFAGNGAAAGAPRPRIVIVSSETHRSAKPLDLDRLGDYVEYGAMGSVAQYAHTKLLLCTLASELSRRLSDEQGVDVSVHSLCPGPVNSNMAREAPAWVKPVLGPVMKVFFSKPEVAARPVVYLAGAQALEGQTGRYMHLMREKEPLPAARDLGIGERLWQRASRLLEQAGVGA
jgi:NAD(P)-dependent dehydrogenase (short-subunit alcohol dehydrogenase family)